MPAKLLSAGGLTPGLCLFGLLWAGSVAAVYWDLRRRSLSRPEQLAWLALAAVVPIVGLLAYLLFKALGRAFPLPTAFASAENNPRRVTLLRPVPEAAPRTGTIVAADLVRETMVERPAPPPPPVVESPVPPPLAPPISPPMVTLSVVAGPHSGQVLAAVLPARLGRGGEVALRLDQDQGVSREHAELYWHAGRLHIRDLGSTHGTTVNGKTIQDAPLAPGDKIELGLSTLVVKEAA